MGKFADQLRAFALRTEGLQERTVRLAALEVWSRLIVRSPVDVGRFRAAWSVRLDELVLREAADIDPATEGPIAPPDPPAFVDRVIGRTITIGNNLPYAQALENGGSKQAPNGMVKITAMEWPQIVRGAIVAARAEGAQ